MGANENKAGNAKNAGQIWPDCLNRLPSWRMWIAVIVVAIAGAILDVGDTLVWLAIVVYAIILGVQVRIDLRRGNYRILGKAEIKRELRVTGLAFLLAVPVTVAVAYFELWIEMLLGLPLLVAVVTVIAKIKERRQRRRTDG